jgi:hypothetical protein
MLSEKVEKCVSRMMRPKQEEDTQLEGKNRSEVNAPKKLKSLSPNYRRELIRYCEEELRSGIKEGTTQNKEGMVDELIREEEQTNLETENGENENMISYYIAKSRSTKRRPSEPNSPISVCWKKIYVSNRNSDIGIGQDPRGVDPRVGGAD